MDSSNEQDDEKELSECLNCMLRRVAQSSAHFKHQQRGDPDLTLEDKTSIARQVLKNSPAKFLFRFGKYLEAEDLQNFSEFDQDYEVSFYLKEIAQRLGSGEKFDLKKIRNRRFNALKKLTSDGLMISRLSVMFVFLQNLGF